MKLKLVLKRSLAAPVMWLLGLSPCLADFAPPVANADDYTAEINAVLNVSAAAGVLANDTDPDTEPLTAIIVSSPASGGLVLNSDGSFSYTPNLDFTGADSFTYKANDGDLDSNVATVTLAVIPRSGGLLANGGFEVGAPADFGPLDDWTVAGNPFGYTTDDPYTPTEGSRMVVFNGGGDDFGGQISQTFTTVIGQTYLLQFDLGVVGDPGRQQRMEISVLSGGTDVSWQEDVTAEGSSSSVWSPKAYVFVADSTETTLTFTDVSASIPPSGDPTNTDMLLDDVRVTPGALRTLTVNSTPASGLNITVSPLDENSAGDGVTGFTRSYNDGATVTLTAPLTDGGINVFQKWVRNGTDLTDSPTVIITIAGDQTLTAFYAPNTPPVAADDSHVVEAGATLTVPAPGILENDTDAESDPLTAVLDNAPPGFDLNLSPDGGFTYIAGPEDAGIQSFTYFANDGESNSAPATVSINVVPRTGGLLANGGFEQGLNYPGFDDFFLLYGWTVIAGDPFGYGENAFPFATYDPIQGERTAVFNGGTNSYTDEISQTFPTIPGQSYVIEFDLGISGTLGREQKMEISASGAAASPWGEIIASQGPALTQWEAKSLSFVATGTETTLTFRDASGDGDPEMGNPEGTDMMLDDVRVYLSASNLPPVAVDDSGSVNEGGSVILDLAANDTDADDGLDLTSIAIVTGPANGSLLDNGDGTVTYSHNGGETTSDSFTYTIDDQSSATSNTASVNVTITPQNDAPVANDDSGNVNEGGSVILDLAANDSDADDGLDLTSIAIVTGPANGSLLDNGDGTVTYSHNGSETTSDSFTYTIEDQGSATSNTASVNVTITPQNDAPVAADDSGNVNEGGGVILNLAANDSDADDGLDLTSIAIVTSPANGSVLDNGDGTVTYTHDGSETTSDTFTYTIDDQSSATSNTASVSVTVTPQNDAPVASDDSGNVNEGGSVILDLAANDTDTDDDIDLTSIAIVAGPAHGSLLDNGDGTVTYSHDGSETTSDSFTYTIEDQSSATSNTATVSITVTPQNDAPVAVSDAYSTDEDTPLAVPALTGVLANDTDDGPGTLTATLIQDVSSGTLSLAQDGGFTFTPAEDFNGGVTFTYKAGDGELESDIVTVTITVNSVDDPPVADDQTVALDEDTSLPITLTGSDDGGGSLLFAVLGGPSHGTLRINGAVATYTPDKDYYGPDAIYFVAFTFSGGPQVSSTATVSITVNSVNDAPVANDDSGSVNEGGSAILDLAANDTDADDGLDLTSIAIVTGPANGSLLDNGDGTVTYTHDGSETTSDSFTYTIDDLTAETSNTASVNITVTPQNDAPVASDDSGSVNEGGSVILDLAANDTDTDDDIDLTSIAIVAGPAHGSLLDNGDGTVTYTHDGSETTSDSFTYTIDDQSSATSNTASVSITVTPQNDAPVANDDSGNANEGGNVILNLAANDTDADDGLDLTSIAIVTGPANGSVLDNGDGTVTYSHNGGETTSDSFTYTIEDQSSATSNTASVSITVTPQNDAPVASDDSGNVNEGGSVILDLAANDSDADDGLDLTSIAIVTGPANGSLLDNGDGTVTYSHNGSETTNDSFTYTIDDQSSATSNTASVSITVTPQNDAPVASDDSGSVNEGGSVILDLAANDTDTDDDIDLTSIAIVAGPAHGSLLDNGDGTVTYTHDGSETTSDSFTYTIEDQSSATSNTATVSITVTPQNDAPVAADDSGNVNEGGNVILDLAANDSDADDGLDLTSIAIVAGPANGSLLDNGDGTVTYTHNGSETTSDSFTYTIDDLTAATSNTATVSITVTPQNDAPVASDDSGSVNEGGSVILNLAANDTDSDDDIDLTSIAIVAGPAHGSLLDNGDGTVTYTHDGSETTSDSFTYTIEDQSSATSNTASVSITVTPQNDAPVAADDSGNVNEGGNVILDLAANDTDADDGLDLTSIAIVTGPANGSVLDNGDGTVTYTHDGTETTSDSFTYTIEDQSSATSNTATVSITVTPQNDAPVANDDSGNVNEGGNVILDLAANDTDADDGLDLTSIAIVTGPANGSVLDNGDGTVTYTHDGTETTSDSFTYTIEDQSSATSNTATVSITVTPQNDAPVANDDSGNVNEGGNVILDLAANDTDADDGLDLTSIAIVTGPANGSVLDNGDGTVTYTHDGTETTSDSFTYTIEDQSSATSNTATVSITVTPQNDAPVANDDSGNVNEGGNVILDLAANDTDADDGLDLTSIAIVTGPANGSVLDNGDGTVTYTHDGTETTSDSFTYTIEDQSSATSNTATVSITVTPQNDAPVANDDSGNVNEGGSVILNLAANDSDADDGLDLTSIAIVAGPANGSVLDNGDGTVTYTHDGTETTTDSFTYTIEDQSSATSDTATVSITITPQNDVPVASDDSGNVNEGGSVILNLAANDSDADDGLDLASIAIVTGPANGSLLDNGDGTVTYTHDGTETTSDSFTYTIDDQSSATSNTATVNITVFPAPDNDFSAWLTENGLPADPTFDTDKDSVDNIIEYIIGGDPVNRNDTDLLPSGGLVTADPDEDTNSSSYLLFTYRRTNRAAIDDTIAIAAEWSTDLSSPWNDAASTEGVVILEQPHPEEEDVGLVRVYIPQSLEQSGRLFVRLSGGPVGTPE